MISEVAVKTAEVVAEGSKEVAKEAGKQAIDIGKRIDVTKSVAEMKDTGVDIKKRISSDTIKIGSELKTQDLKEIVNDYINDLKSRSECPDTIGEKNIDPTKLEKVSPEKVNEMREEFDDNKAKFRKEWEQLNNREWPKYKEDVYNDNGIRIRKAGDNYDAHHILPLSLGGRNEAINLTPLDLTKHSEIHSLGGSCTKLKDAMEGVARL